MERIILLFLLILLLGTLWMWLMPRKQQPISLAVASPQPVQMAVAAPTEGIEISLPYMPESWGLVVEELVCYDGAYIEDGTHAQVENVAGVILNNAGERGISFVVLAVEQGSRTIYFTATWLPPGQRVMVLAMERAAFDPQPITGCRVLGIRWDDFESAPVAVQVHPDAGLEVTNLTARRQEGVCLRFKLYMEDIDLFIGGITQCVQIAPLSPGETCLLFPEDFVPEQSQLVAKIK